MASYFNLLLDTLAPAGISISINSGATYTTSRDVALTIGTTDNPTTGYQMKVWGIDGVATEGAASWETYATSKNVTLITGDGLKTVYVKIRDDVGNESSSANDTITLNTTAPAVTISAGPDYSKISKVATFNVSAFSFTSDVIFAEYKIKVVPATNSLHDAGTAIGTVGGSANMSGNAGSYPADTAINCTIYGADLEAASSGDGTKIIKVFVKNLAGLWNEA